MKTKTINLTATRLSKCLIIFLFSLVVLSVKGQTFPYLSFTNGTLASGTPLQQGAVYKFPNVTSGVDAFVTIQNLFNGATVADIDQFGGIGYDGGFQPIVNSLAGSSSYARFLIVFKNTDGTPHIFPNLGTTGLDIDGTTLNLLEFCTINMNGGSATYQSNTPEISVAPVGTAFKASNISGNNISGIDSTQKQVMFTVKNANISSLTIDFGSVSTSGSGNRNFSAFFGSFQYPVAKIVLPVKLISFSAMLIDNKAAIKWTTASEMNVSHFEVEKSYDGKNYNSAGVVFAYGNTNEKMNYIFSDNINASQSNVIYYRLRSVDIDGKGQYSDTRIIRISKQAENAIAVVTYPNPVSNELRVTIPNNWQNRKVTYEMFNSNGQVSKKSETANSSQTENINVSSLAPGFYIVKVNCDGQSAQQKIIKK